MSNRYNRKSSILDRCMRVIIQERLDHDMNRYTECNNKVDSTAKAEAIHDNYVKRKHRRLESEYSSQYYSTIKKQQEYPQEVAMKEQEYIEFVDVHNRRTKVYLSPEHISTIEFLRETGSYHDLYKYIESLDKKQEKKQDYLKQGYKVDNLSNGSIGIYLGNDEDAQELEYKTQKASNAQQENTPMIDKLTVYKQELLELQHALDRHNKQLLMDIEYYELTKHAYGSSTSTIEARKQGIELYKTRIELLERQIDNLAVALQQLSDARVSLLQAYTTGIGVLVAENDLIAVREQYNAVHGV